MTMLNSFIDTSTPIGQIVWLTVVVGGPLALIAAFVFGLMNRKKKA